MESVCADTVVIFNGIGFCFFPVETRGESLHRWTELCVGLWTWACLKKWKYLSAQILKDWGPISYLVWEKWATDNHYVDLRMTLIQAMDNALPSILGINVLFQWTRLSFHVLPDSSQHNLAMGRVVTFRWPEDGFELLSCRRKSPWALGARRTWVGFLFLFISCVLLNSSLHPSRPWALGFSLQNGKVTWVQKYLGLSSIIRIKWCCDKRMLACMCVFFATLLLFATSTHRAGLNCSWRLILVPCLIIYSGSQSLVPWPAAAAALRNVLEMQIPRTRKWRPTGWGSAMFYLQAKCFTWF